jgi:hypothetical protein
MKNPQKKYQNSNWISLQDYLFNYDSCKDMGMSRTPWNYYRNILVI